MFLHGGKLLVGHEVEDLSPGMTFEALYVEPLVTLFGRNGGGHGRIPANIFN